MSKYHPENVTAWDMAFAFVALFFLCSIGRAKPIVTLGLLVLLIVIPLVGLSLGR